MVRYLCVLAVVSQCGGLGGGGKVGKQVTVLGSTGLDTTTSPYSLDPRALVKADNAVIDRTGVIEGRRGFVDSGMAVAPGNILTWGFKSGYMLPQWGTNLGYLSGTTLNTYQGDYTPVSGYRTRIVEVGNTAYIATKDRLYALESVTANPMKAGMLTPIGASATVTGSTTGFLAANAQAAYRFVWGRKDSYGRVILSAPSERLTVSGMASSVATSNIGQTNRAAGPPAVVTVNTAAAHGLSSSNSVYIQSQDVNYPSGTFTITVTGANSFTYKQDGNAGVASTVAITIYRAFQSVQWSVPIPGKSAAAAAGGVVRASNVVTVTVSALSAPYTLTAGDLVYLFSADTNFPAGMKLVTSVAHPATSFTYAEVGANATSTRPLVFNTELQAGSFLQVYRSLQSASASTEPTDILFQVYEYQLTADTIKADVIAPAFITVTDTTSDGVLNGTPLYTNDTEEGIANANSTPPVAADIAWDRDVLWYGNLTEAPLAKLQLLSTANFTPDSGATEFYLNGNLFVSTAGAAAAGTFKVYTSGTTSQNNANTAQSIISVINKAAPAIKVFAQYGSGPNDPPGIILLYGLTPNITSFVGSISNAFDFVAGTAGSEWSPRVMSQKFVNAYSRAGSTVTATTDTAHGFVTNQEVYVAGLLPNFTAGIRVVASTPTTTTFTYAEAGTVTSVSPISSWAWSVPDYNQASQAFVGTPSQHAVAWAKSGEPECVPLANRIYLGRADKKVLRVVPLRHSRFVFKEDGLWRITGNDASNYAADVFDSTLRLLGPETIAVVQNTIFGLTTKGVVAVTESGVAVVSGPIKKSLQQTQTLAPNQIKTTSFGVGYESDRKYILWVPATDSDTYAVQGFVFDLDSHAWTRWILPSSWVYYGAVDPTTDLLWLSRGLTLSKERKVLDYTDHRDEGGVAIPFDIQYAPVTGGSPGTLKHFTDFSVLLSGAHLTGLTASFGTDASTTPTAVALVPPGGAGTDYASGPIHTIVPLEDSRGAALNIEITHSAAQEIPAIAGYTLDVESDGGAHVNRQ